MKSQIHQQQFHQPLTRQKGITGISIVLILAVAGFFLAVAMTLFPIYMENYSVSTHVGSLKGEPNIKNMGKRDIIRTLEKRFSIDDVKSVSADDAEFEEIADGYKLTVDYEVRKAFMGNVDIVVVFHEEVDITN